MSEREDLENVSDAYAAWIRFVKGIARAEEERRWREKADAAQLTDIREDGT